MSEPLLSEQELNDYEQLFRMTDHLDPDRVFKLLGEVRRLRGELLKRNIPLGGCQCACHGCQWCEC